MHFITRKVKEFLGVVSPKVYWFIWEFCGLRFIFHKIYPVTSEEENSPNYRKPSTIGLWILTLYFAAFGVASQRYENKLDRAEHKVNLLASQLSGDAFLSVVSGVPRLQDQDCPIEPFLLIPASVYHSIMYEENCPTIIEDLKGIISDWKTQLPGVNLSGVDLSIKNKLSSVDLFQPNFIGAKLARANLTDANLINADFSQANFDLATLNNVDFTNSILIRSEFTGAKLIRSRLIGAALTRARLNNVDFSHADLTGADLTKAFIQSSNLTGANLTNSTLLDAELSYANLSNANLKNANLESAVLFGADLSNTNFSNANLTKVKFMSAQNLTLKQLLQSKSLYRSKGIDPKIKEIIMATKPWLFDQLIEGKTHIKKLTSP